jgi:hypothetical protein
MTHEFGATMVGGDRPRVTMALRVLRSRRLVRQQRGEVSILNRVGGIGFACDCYSRVIDSPNGLTPPKPIATGLVAG